MLSEVVVAVKMPPTRSRTERPRAPLLYAVTGFLFKILSVSGRLRSMDFGSYRVANETPPFLNENSNLHPSSGVGTMAAGQFDWGGFLQKSNGGVLRFPQHGW